MNFDFASRAFLAAMVAAAGPLIIHLLNRQRYRTIDWAPMEFLLRAVRRRRRRVQLRDLLLLLLRTLAIVFFVLAMARPIWTTQSGDGYAGQPVHAVLIFDNSLSMAYAPLDKSRLELAKDKARQFIRDLPAGSDVTVIPMCEQGDAWFSEVYDSKEDAMDAVARIEVVDRTARLDDLPAAAKQALGQSGTAPTKRLVVFSDMQQTTWEQAGGVQPLDELGDVQYVAMRSHDEQAVDENTWVERLQLRGGFAESGVPTVFDAVIRHEGTEPRRQVRTILTVDGEVAGEQLIDLQPGGSKRVAFDYTFEALGGVVNPAFVPVHVELENDRLAADDRRYYVAPVFKRVPVLFVDQHGDFEQPDQNRFGETWPLRVLYASRLGMRRDAVGRAPHLRPITIDAVTPEHLKDVRLVVVAGVAAPAVNQIEMLRKFVERGGQLLITAGGEFDAGQWTTVAWNDGAGILPAPLAEQMLGALPKAGSSAAEDRFYLDAGSLHRDLFDLQLSEDDWNDLVGSSFFYQAVRVDALPDEAQQAAANGNVSGDDTPAAGSEDEAVTPLSFAGGRSRVVGRFDNGEVFAVHQTIGEGNVILVTTSCFPSWNNLAVQPGILLYDRMITWLIGRSIPERNFVERREHVLPVDRRDQQRAFQLISTANSQATPLGVEAVGADRFAVVARGIDQRDILEIRRRDADDGPQDGASTEVLSFSVNGPPEESDLAGVATDEFPQAERWLGPNDAISLAGDGSVKRDLWLYLLVLAVVCLLVEMIVAAGSLRRRVESTEVAT